MKERLIGNGGILTKRQKVNPAKSERVIKVFYTRAERPKYYSVIGKVKAQRYSFISRPYPPPMVMSDLKIQAAAMGADAITNIKARPTKTTADAIVVYKD